MTNNKVYRSRTTTLSVTARLESPWIDPSLQKNLIRGYYLFLAQELDESMIILYLVLIRICGHTDNILHHSNSKALKSMHLNGRYLSRFFMTTGADVWSSILCII
jgi:hypothetical protein